MNEFERSPTVPKSMVQMGIRNYLIAGVSGTGKTSVAEELQRRGHHVIHGDRDLAYRGDPETGASLEAPVRTTPADTIAWRHKHWIWDVDKVRSLVADRHYAMTFFCGGSRNLDRFIDLFDKVYVLDVDLDTLSRRLAARPEDEFGGKPSEQAFIRHLQATGEDVPKGVSIDATAPIGQVVDKILMKCI